MTNLVILVGRVARPPEARELPSGDRLVAYELVIERAGERGETVPVVRLVNPTDAFSTFDTDDVVQVVGRVRRRFFRAGGSTQSRTEVVAESVVLAGGTEATEAARRATAVLVTMSEED